eukprot:TRINITY_DN5026_c0_g1_i1.p3 TRINITY_DN5026_c0_g1~~TRINITY_DN5026_c0_g1_i1.p3  ORF type:complete len:136 (+),score=47.57 TRINITY_DN5026_c0_g1_i1:93-500(+)
MPLQLSSGGRKLRQVAADDPEEGRGMEEPGHEDDDLIAAQARSKEKMAAAAREDEERKGAGDDAGEDRLMDFLQRWRLPAVVLICGVLIAVLYFTVFAAPRRANTSALRSISSTAVGRASGVAAPDPLTPAPPQA